MTSIYFYWLVIDRVDGKSRLHTFTSIDVALLVHEVFGYDILVHDTVNEGLQVTYNIFWSVKYDALMCHVINKLVNICVLPSVLMVYSGKLVGKIAAFGHGIAMDSAHVVSLLAFAFFLRRDLFSSVILCVDVCCSAALLRALICSFRSGAKLFRLAVALTLLRALISSFCSVVKLFRRALSRSRLAWFLSCEMFALGCLWSAITVPERRSCKKVRH